MILPDLRRLALLLGAPAFLAGSLDAQETAPSVGTGRVAAQLSLGTLALPAGFVTTGLLARRVASSLGASEFAARRAAYIGGTVGAVAATAAVVTALGSTGSSEGSFLAASGGTTAGVLISYGLVTLNRLGSPAREHRCGAICRVSVIAIALLPATGATMSFNATREVR